MFCIGIGIIERIFRVEITTFRFPNSYILYTLLDSYIHTVMLGDYISLRLSF